jgi:threonine dehydratase
MPEVELIEVDREPGAEADLVTLDEIQAAADRIAPIRVRTPLLASWLRPKGSHRSHSVWLKCESLQHAGAFKLRGAYNFISSLSETDRSRGLVTYSSGNHAQGVAWSARELGLSATVVMPVDAPSVKRDAVLEMGAEVELIGTTTIERKARAEEIVETGGGVMVPPFDDTRIIAGQGTVGLEILSQLAEAGSGKAGLVVIPIGGGGLIAGVSAAIRSLSPDTRIVGVEPEGAPKMRNSLDAGHPVTLSHIDTIADGLKPVRPGDITFAHVSRLVDDVVTVTDQSIRDAVLWCYRRRLVVEPSGAATLAGLLSGRVPLADSGDTIAILSGGNLDPELLQQWISEESAGG